MVYCKICQAESKKFGQGEILEKYYIDYFQCVNCGFVQTEEPYWLEEAYSSAIADSDVGLVSRNTLFVRNVSNLIMEVFDPKATFIDYGGGYGLFVRMMRDIGFDFHWYDKYCENIFAKNFELEPLWQKEYELVTCFEVFEHWSNPLNEIEEILKLSPNIFFSTELLPQNNPKPEDWWYYALHEGQHISLYTFKSLSIIAKKFNLNFYSNGSSIHLLTQKEIIPIDLFEKILSRDRARLYKQSLIQQDYLRAINKISQKKDDQGLKKSIITKTAQPTNKEFLIIIDAVFFQLYQTGIARLWRSLLEEWSTQSFAKYILVLDRAGTAPKVSGIRYRTITEYNYANTDTDRQILQQVCDEEGADLFISTYYTTPLDTPSVFMAYDMIPEMIGADFQEPMWREKHYGIQHASAYICISENTAQDLLKCFPDISQNLTTVAHCGVSSQFSPASIDEINSFKTKYGISKPYFLLVGLGSNYKNAKLFFNAFSSLNTKQGFEIVCTGSSVLLADRFRHKTSGVVVHTLKLTDEELSVAYSGAIALVHPSKYEGFGLPILEAMACKCPVITCPNSSLPEVAGKAAIYVDDEDVDGLANALCDIQKPSIRNSLLGIGLEQSKKFSWESMAEKVRGALIQATLLSLNLKDINMIIFPDWLANEDELGLEIQELIKRAIANSDNDRTTLLIHRTNISEEDVNLFLSSVVMNIMMEEEDLEISKMPEISLVANLYEVQWLALVPRIHRRIVLKNENKDAVFACQAEQIPILMLEELG